MKHYAKVEDLNKDEYLELVKRTDYFTAGLKEGKDFTNLCPGKVIATMFFQESARTSSTLQSAMIALGGGWLGIAGTEGTYIGSGEEEMSDFLRSYASVSDIMGIRHKELDLDTIREDFPIPLINGMCGKSEHTLGALGWICVLSQVLGNIEGIKVGIYGMPKSSRPSKAFIKAISYFKPTIYVDSITPEFAVPEDIRKFAEANGAKIIEEPLADFIGEVDFLNITEGLPQAGEDQAALDAYIKAYRVLASDDIAKMKNGSCFMAVMPAKMMDGRSVLTPELDKDSKNISWKFLSLWKPVSMSLITYLLNVDVKY